MGADKHSFWGNCVYDMNVNASAAELKAQQESESKSSDSSDSSADVAPKMKNLLSRKSKML
jgi:hypothetical protein